MTLQHRTLMSIFSAITTVFKHVNLLYLQPCEDKSVVFFRAATLLLELDNSFHSLPPYSVHHLTHVLLHLLLIFIQSGLRDKLFFFFEIGYCKFLEWIYFMFGLFWIEMYFNQHTKIQQDLRTADIKFWQI